MHDVTPATDTLSLWLREGWAREAAVRAVEVEGATVRYRAWNLDETDKPGLVLVHGFIAHARWWDHIAPHFTDRFRVIAPDFTGMGDSDRRPTYSRHQYSRELLAVARDAGFERAILAAHSFGSGCALYAAKLDPDLVSRVIVIDGRVYRRDEPDHEPPAAIRAENVYPSFEAARARYRLLPPGDWPIPEIVDYIARHSIRRIDDDRWGWKFDPETSRTARNERIGPDIEGLTVPIDFIHAANSDVVEAADLATFRAHMPTCGTPVTVPISHHHVMIEQPVGLIAALNGLLAHPREPVA